VTDWQRPVWGKISILFGAWGATHNGTTWYTVPSNGTATINATTGLSMFSTSTSSGHYVLTLATRLGATMNNLFDCYNPVGVNSVGSYGPCLAPLMGTGTLANENLYGVNMQ
jgi:hypothetical protein